MSMPAKVEEVKRMKTKALNRRVFLVSTGLVTAALGLTTSSAVTGGDAAGARRKIRIGFLGGSHSHAAAKLGVVLASKDFELVGVCEESASVHQDCEKLGVKIISQEELLARSEVIAVESAVRDHAGHAVLALKAGKHVHVEKPPAATLTELQEIVALAREKKCLLQTGYMWRYNPA